MLLQSLLKLDNNLLEIAIRFFANLLVITALVRGIYYYHKKDSEYAFTFFLFNVLIFFVCYLMQSVEISLGFGFGLFAIFGILRYRTDTIPIKEMTYLFTSITVALINAIGTLDWVTIFMDLCILVFVFAMEKVWFAGKQSSTNIQYEKIELLKGDSAVVIADLRERTHLNVISYTVKSYNFLNDSAVLKIFYLPHE